MVRKHTENVGDGSSKEIVVAHGLETRDVVVSIISNEAPFDIVMSEVRVTSQNEITLAFGRAPSKAEYRVVVVG